MTLSAWITQIFAKPKKPKTRTAIQLCLLSLEERTTPTSYTVINTNDSDDGSLRAAITTANSNLGNHDITFNLLDEEGIGPYTIILQSALPTIINNGGTITITGLGSSSLTINGNNGDENRDFNIFNIGNGGSLNISGVTVSGARTTGNGGAFNNSGNLTISNSILSGNTASGGGAIANQGTATVSYSTLSKNSITFDSFSINQGGAIYNTSLGGFNVSNSTLLDNSAEYGGGIFNNNLGNFTVTNSTLSGNNASKNGGGIYNGSSGTLTLLNSTISGNAASSSGGGVFNNSVLYIANGIIANNTIGSDFAGGSNSSVNGFTFSTPSTNFNSLVTIGTFDWATTVTPAQLNLETLKFNGGPTLTMALLPGSVAIGAGNVTVSNASPVNGLDQRGFARSSATPSIGAFEFYNPPTVTSVSPASGTTAGSTPITITGTNFVAGPTTVTIGGVAATNVVVANPTTITANTPAGTIGTASVLVTTAGGANAANTLFTYYAPTPLVIGTTGGSSQGSTLNFVDPSTRATNTVVPFPGFMGEVRVAAGDINGDGKMETIAAAGTGGGPAVNILDATGKSITAFFAYDPAFRGGLYISVSDVNNDGFADIVTGAGAGGGPHVKIFNGKNLQEMGSFFAFDEGFTGGVSVASADINGDGTLDIVTGAGPGGGPHVKVFDGKTNSLISQWFAYASDFTGGVFVAIGDIGNDGKFEVVTGAGVGGGPVVAVFNPFTGALQTQFFAYGESFTGGVRVGVSDGNGDGVLDLVTGAGPGGGPHVKGFNYPQLDLLYSFFSGPDTNRDGVNVS